MKLVKNQGYSVAEAARNLGVNANLLGRWKKESEQPENDSTSAGSLVPMQAELKRLKRENVLQKLPVRLNHASKGVSIAVFGTKIRFNLPS